MSMSLTSVQHGVFRDVNGVVPGLESEPERDFLLFGMKLALPVFVSFFLSFFMVH